MADQQKHLDWRFVHFTEDLSAGLKCERSDGIFCTIQSFKITSTTSLRFFNI